MRKRIKKIEVFNNLQEDTYKLLEEIIVSKKLAKNEILFYEREAVEDIYFIEEGKVSLFKINENGERKVMFILRSGQMINDVLIEDDKKTAVSGETFEKTKILECNSKDLLKIMQKDFQLTKNILLHQQNINRRLYRQLKNSISIKMDKKLAAKLYRIGREFGIKKGDWTLINANLTITYIADMLGCKRETISRAMKELKNKNLVKIENRNVYIKQEELAVYFKSI